MAGPCKLLGARILLTAVHLALSGSQCSCKPPTRLTLFSRLQLLHGKAFYL